MKNDFCTRIGILATVLGLSLHSINSEQLQRRSVLGAAVADDPRELRITAVAPGGPAAAAGLKTGDEWSLCVSSRPRH
jgi:predicted metalloprotease with PDZ domain